jgi:hypothetical protein
MRWQAQHIHLFCCLANPLQWWQMRVEIEASIF